MNNPCAVILKDAVGAKEITQEQAEDLVKRMRNRAKARQEARGGNAFEALRDIAGEMAVEANLDIKLQKRNALLNLNARVAGEARVDAALARKGTAADGVLSIEIGSVKKFPGALASADLRAHALKKKMEFALQAELEKNGIWHEARTGELDDEIIAAFDNPDAARPQVKAALKKWGEIMEELVGVENRQGGNIGFLEDWRMPQAWDSMRVRILGFDGGGEFYKKVKTIFKSPEKELAKKRFIELHKGRLDAERTFKGMDEDAYLSNVFENQWNDHHNIPGEIDPLSEPVRLHGGLANRVSQPRLLHFKSAKDWWAVHKAIGKQGSITDLMLATINRHAHNIALLEAWGPGGKLNRERFIEEQMLRLKDRPDSAEQLDSLKKPMLEASWATVSGASRFSSRPMVSSIVDNIKVFSRFSTMGGSGLTAFVTDKAFMQRALERVGMPRLQALAQLTRYSMPRSAEEKRFAKMFLVGIEGTTHSIANRFSQDIETARYLKTADHYFWKANLLEKVTFDHRAAAAETLSAWSAEHADLGWKSLPEQLRTSYEMSGLDSHLWDIYRKYGVGETTRGKFLAEDQFANIPDSEINKLVEARGRAVTSANRLRAKDEINSAWREWLSSELRFAVPEGTAREQALWMGSMRRGTWQAELWSMIGLLKTFPLAIMNTVSARDLYSGGAGRMTEALFSLNRGHLDIAATVAYTTVLGYTSWTIKNALAGKGAPPLEDEEGKPNIGTLLGSMTRGGGLGILGDFMLQDYDTRYRHWSSAALGPVVGQVDSAVAIGSSLMRMETDGVLRDSAKLIENNTPFINLFYTRWAMNHLFLHSLHESLSPGVLERQRETFEKQGGKMSPLLPVFDPEKRFRPFE